MNLGNTRDHSDGKNGTTDLHNWRAAAPERRPLSEIDPFTRLGVGALNIICTMAQPIDLCRLLVASRAFHGLADDNRLWIDHILRDFPLISEEQLKWRLNGITAKEFYLEMAYVDQDVSQTADKKQMRQDCTIFNKVWYIFHRHIITLVVPFLFLIITALLVARIEQSEKHSKVVESGVQKSNVKTVVGNIDHTWVALLWWLLLPMLGTAAMSIWYFRIWHRNFYFRIVGPFKAFSHAFLSDSASEMRFMCPGFMCLLFGIGLFSLRVSSLVLDFSYWWVTFPLIVAPVFLLGWAYQVASHCGNIFDALLGIGVTLFLTIPLLCFATLITLRLDGRGNVSVEDILVPAFVSESVFLVVLCSLLVFTESKKWIFHAFGSFCVLIPLLVFQTLLLYCMRNEWSYGYAFAPVFVGEIALVIFGCLFNATELRIIPEEWFTLCLDMEDPQTELAMQV
ncbi:hypothetical protein AAMO2058_000361800 [Amorphochlora amoebiformis]|mmetsp:Transcript_6412/g.9850  ORF Transcript_6412/g.9850 Transcript_6412/m.9850 type:complete len:453 (-) Transcript_6412:139-1497(-)